MKKKFLAALLAAALILSLAGCGSTSGKASGNDSSADSAAEEQDVEEEADEDEAEVDAEAADAENAETDKAGADAAVSDEIANLVDVTNLLGTDDLEQYRDQKVAIKGVKSVDTEDPGGDLLRFLYGPDGNGDSGDDLYFSVEKDGKTYQFIVDAGICGPETEVYQTVENVEEDAIVDLVGIVRWNKGPDIAITEMKVQD